MARVVTVSIPKQKLGDVQMVLSASSVIDSYDVCSSNRISGLGGHEEERATITFKLKGTNLARTIKELKDVGVGQLFGEIDVVPLSCTTARLPKDRHRLHSANALCPSRYNRYSTLEIHQGIMEGSHMTFDHLMLITCASFIAAVGLLCDQIVAILASFFISPLMQMIIATTWGVVISDRNLLVRGFRNMLIGAVWCFGVGAVVGCLLCIHTDDNDDFNSMYRGSGLYYGISVNSVQITSRGPPVAANLLSSMVIAMFSGVAIALGFASGISSALSGVALSASLLPPVVNAGLMVVLGWVYPGMRCGPVEPHDQYSLHEVAGVSICIYIVNIMCVMVFATLTFKFKRIGGLSLREQGWRSSLLMSNELADTDSELDATDDIESHKIGDEDAKDEALLTLHDREGMVQTQDESPKIV